MTMTTKDKKKTWPNPKASHKEEKIVLHVLAKI